MQWSIEGEGLKVDRNMCASIGTHTSTLKDTLIHCPFTYLSKHIARYNHNNISNTSNTVTVWIERKKPPLSAKSKVFSNTK